MKMKESCGTSAQLFEAITSGYPEMVCEMLNQGADVNGADNDGFFCSFWLFNAQKNTCVLSQGKNHCGRPHAVFHTEVTVWEIG
jgi:hypothetical protein